MLGLILVATLILLGIAYRFYGGFLSRRFEISDATPTPATKFEDGVDYVPTKASIVFGHHFSSIAGAGPIVGPIVAATAFGWGPTWLWVLLGAVFVGGVHDFGATAVSLRYQGKSIIEALRDIVGQWTGKLFLVFVLVTLVYVIIVFLDLTATSFVTQPAVATASGWFVLMALAFGQFAGRTRLPSWAVTGTFILLTYLGLVIGNYFPVPPLPTEVWMGVILVYCLLAAVLPVNVLMQPRDFLSATFLYAIMGLGIVGAFASPASFDLPMFISFESENLGLMVPFLFITVACGACSGFHSMVASGTTSKQLRRESDARRVSYGGMLVEAVLATFAIGCVAVAGGMQGSAVNTFAAGAAVFFGVFGIPQQLGVEFATLAVSTFLLTTLDTCTRLARFLIEELLDVRNATSRYLGTLAVVLIAGWIATREFTGLQGEPVAAWLALWPLFGATNQLLAALALITLTVFLRSRKIPTLFVAVPTIIMIVMPMSALIIMAADSRLTSLLRGTALVQLALGTIVIVACLKYLLAKPSLETKNSDK